MKHSFRARLVVVMVAVVVTTTLAVGLLSRRATHGELRSARDHAAGKLRQAIEAAYGSHGSWDDVRTAIAHLAMTERVVIVDATGHVVVAPMAELRGTAARRRPDGAWQLAVDGHEIVLRGDQPLGAGDGTFGTLLVLPGALDEPAQDAIDRWLIWIVAGVGLAGIALAFAIGRSVARPLEDLTEAVGRVTRGDRSVRVAEGPGGELAVLARAFNELLQSLDEQDRLRHTLISDVAHELRSPLATLRYLIEAMQDGVLATDAATLASAHEDVLTLGRLVEDVQDLALADAGSLRIETAPADLHTELAAAMQAIGARARAAEIEVALHVDADVPPVLADRIRLAQITRNLLDNAVAHTPAGGTIQIAARVRSDEQVVEVTITDTGCGIAAAHLPNVFERFYRADPARARGTGGAGLGLAIVKHLVTAHGGQVSATSSVGKGSSFRFTLRAHS